MSREKRQVYVKEPNLSLADEKAATSTLPAEDVKKLRYIEEDDGRIIYPYMYADEVSVKNVGGHVEASYKGVFLGSADTIKELFEDIGFRT